MPRREPVPALWAEPTLPDLDRTVLATHRVPAERLRFEITETSLISRPDAVRTVLQELAGIGVNIAVDDFGTGYAP